jgi:hypothetical protein
VVKGWVCAISAGIAADAKKPEVPQELPVSVEVYSVMGKYTTFKPVLL